MSKISRRNFIKGAGVAALAVAAAGMLAGCGSSAPEMVGVHVGYYYKDFFGDVKPIQDADKYAEVVSVVKGSKVKKSDLKNLQAACNGSTARRMFPMKSMLIGKPLLQRSFCPSNKIRKIKMHKRAVVTRLPSFCVSGGKRCQNYLTNSYRGGGYYIGKAGSTKSERGMQKRL